MLLLGFATAATAKDSLSVVEASFYRQSMPEIEDNSGGLDYIAIAFALAKNLILQSCLMAANVTYDLVLIKEYEDRL